MASKGLDLPHLAHFDPVSDPASIGQSWKAWKRWKSWKSWEPYIIKKNSKSERTLRLYLPAMSHRILICQSRVSSTRSDLILPESRKGKIVLGCLFFNLNPLQAIS